MRYVRKKDRVLLVVANLSDGGDERFQRLYQWLDLNAVNVAKLLMEPHYRHVDVLTKSDDVTSSRFVDRIITLAQDDQTKALDVFLVLHGLQGKLHFNDGSVKSSDLKDQLQAANLQNRLRLLYSVACYGASHAPDFVEAGFRVASGAKGICANGPFDYPAQLINWGRRKKPYYKDVVKAGNNRIGRMSHDNLAKTFGFDDVDSEKVIEGNKYTRIISRAM